MQKLRAVAVAVIATFVVTAGASAQEMRNFDNSWFWGFKSGINTFTAPGRGNTSTVDMGIDWLITRTKGGLYVSGNQSIFERDITVFDNGAATNRTVRINDLRRITLAGVAFPKHFGGITPYAGLGYTIVVLGDARVFVDSASAFPSNAFLDEVRGGGDGRRPNSDNAVCDLRAGDAGAEQSQLSLLERSLVLRVRPSLELW